MRTEEEEIRGGKRATAADGLQPGFREQSLEVRDRSGCLALVDSHLHTHIPTVSSCLMFTASSS